MMQIQKQRRNLQEITKHIEGPAPKVKPMKHLNKQFK